MLSLASIIPIHIYIHKLPQTPHHIRPHDCTYLYCIVLSDCLLSQARHSQWQTRLWRAGRARPHAWSSGHTTSTVCAICKFFYDYIYILFSCVCVLVFVCVCVCVCVCVFVVCIVAIERARGHTTSTVCVIWTLCKAYYYVFCFVLLSIYWLIFVPFTIF